MILSVDKSEEYVHFNPRYQKNSLLHTLFSVPRCPLYRGSTVITINALRRSLFGDIKQYFQ